jgi:transcriptional regulator with GAF, ATPase, and Fis domain
MSEAQLVVDQHLPQRAPDLLLGAGPDGRWRIEQLSAKLADWLGLGDLEVVGRALLDVLVDVTPGLDYLAEEVCRDFEPLGGVAIQFLGTGQRLLLADVEPRRSGHDGWRRVSFYFRLPPAGRARAEMPDFYHGLVGRSAGMREVFRKVSLYAPSDASVVITGETGSGKELVARALHQQSPRREYAFVAINCSAISAELLESELFGHEKGAFTGAIRAHKGRFERADHGTIFLDEIGDMPASAQVKLLRVLEEGRLERVGSESDLSVDVRVVAATNVPLERAVQQSRFRADLYHRLAVLRIHLPPLRQRVDDIPLLVEHFLAGFRRSYGRDVVRLTGEALALLQSYLWPGNVRELRNVLERVFVETRSEVIGARAFREWIRERQNFSPGDWGIGNEQARSLAPPFPLESERRYLAQSAPLPALSHSQAALELPRKSTRPAGLTPADIRRAFVGANGNLTAAARLLGVHRATLYRYLKKYDLSRDSLKS